MAIKPQISTGLRVRDFSCPQCGAKPNKMCRTVKDRATNAHPERYDVLFVKEREMRAERGF